MAARRRDFLAAGVAALGGAAAPAAAKTSEPHRVFDAHLHCPADSGELWQWHTVTPTFRDFVAYLDQTGVQRGIINSQRAQSNGGRPADFIAGNREVARFVEKSKGRFVGACAVNPQFVDEALKEIEYCRTQLGFVWVGELCNYMIPYEYTIKEFELLVEQVVKLGMILDVHTDHEEMDFIIRSFPEATLVFPHFGGHGTIFERIDLIAQNSNCYIDTSGSGYERVGMLEYAVETIGPQRVLFGSDFSINDPSSVLARIENSFLSPDEKARVLSGNLEALLARFG
jgi:predicted TIM-barrel fold metal-dependent hydrolase